MKVRIDHLDANPFRHIDRYPIREDKIAALLESIHKTGFWDNMVGRTVDGRVQIAYGHHRLEALRREYGPDHEVNLIVRDLSDELMLKIMANENMQEWGSSAGIEHETIRSVVHAYAAGQIELEEPARTADTKRLRYAPSFLMGEAREDFPSFPYTGQSVANFLGWVEPSGKRQRRVDDALTALGLIEDGTLTEADFEGLTSYQASAVVQEARKAKAGAEAAAKRQRELAERQAKAAERARKNAEKAERERAEATERAARARDEVARRRAEEREAEASRKEAAARKEQREAERQAQVATRREQAHQAEGRKAAKAVGTGVSQALKTNKTSYGSAERTARDIRNEAAPEKPPLDIDKYAVKIAGRVYRVLDSEKHDLAKALDELIRFRKHMSPGVALNLSRELTSLAARVDEYRTKLARVADDAPDRDPDLEVLDAEVVFEHAPLKEITQ